MWAAGGGNVTLVRRPPSGIAELAEVPRSPAKDDLTPVRSRLVFLARPSRAPWWWPSALLREQICLRGTTESQEASAIAQTAHDTLRRLCRA